MEPGRWCTAECRQHTSGWYRIVLYKRSEHGTERNKRLIDFGLSLFRLKLGHPLAAVIGQFERPAAVCDQSRTVVIVSRSQPATLATALNRRFCRCCRLALVLFHCVIWNWWSRLCIWYVYFYRFKCYSSVKHYIIALHVLCTLFFCKKPGRCRCCKSLTA